MEPTAAVKVELLPDGNVKFSATGPDKLQLLGLLEVARSEVFKLMNPQPAQPQQHPRLVLPLGRLPPFNGGEK